MALKNLLHIMFHYLKSIIVAIFIPGASTYGTAEVYNTVLLLN